MITGTLTLLIVDDCQDDADLVVRQFTKAGYRVDYRRVDTRPDMARALAAQSWDAIVADVTMPTFSAEAALDCAHDLGVDYPFLVVSGVVGEENAVALLKAGAHDFVLKSRMARLVPAFERERREAKLRRAHRVSEEALRRSEERYALAAQGANDGLWDWNLLTGEVYYSARWGEIVGLERTGAGHAMADWLDRIHPDDRDTVEDQLRAHLDGATPHFAVEHRLRHTNGGTRWVLARGVAIGDDAGTPCRMAGSLSDTTARKQAELKLEDANQQLRTAVAARTRFLASASHDMRQPVQALFCFTAVLAGMVGEQPGAQATLGDIEAGLSSLKELLDALLDVSKLDAGMVTPAPVAVAVDDILERIATEMAPMALAKGLRLRLNRCGATARSDPALLARILRNLAENAIRYTDSGGVLLACRRRGATLRLEVWDTGIGIPDSHRDMVFEEFFQLGNPERDRRKGLGLGLSIVDRLSRLLGHSIEMRSVPGRGSMFAVVMPQSSDVSTRSPCSAAGAMV